MQNNIQRLGYRRRWMTGVANPIKFNVMNVVHNKNKRKLMKQKGKEYEKNVIRKKKKLKIDNLSCTSLPEDIIIEILTKLPVTSLLRFRCVCKSWNNFFKTADFAKLQLDYSLRNHKDGILMDFFGMQSCGYLDHDTLCSYSSTPLYEKSVDITFPVGYGKKEIVGSCNGLVCYTPNGPCKEDIIIFNPFTRDCKKIPTPPSQPGGTPCTYGFGYDLKTEDYKIAVYHYDFGIYDSHVHIYSSKLNSWKTANIPFEIPDDRLVFFNGSFHWVNGQYKEIRFFDTANDTVEQFLLPQRKFRFAQVCVLGGTLCVTGWDYNLNRQVWIMKEYGVSESWTKMFTIRGNYKDEVLGLQHLDMKQSFKNYATLLYHDNCCTYSYDLNHQVAKQVKIDGKITPAYTKHTFTGSLVSPSLY